MATHAFAPPTRGFGDDRFFLGGAIAIAAVVVAGFSLQLAMGRSSFSGSPLLLHAHAIVFMGWLALFILQTVFATSGNIALHRRLGWVGAGWMVLMLVLGCLVTAAMVRRGGVPFFFRPQQFLVFDPLSLLTFVGLTAAAIGLRRQTDWHRRLHFCGMAVLTGPALGRLLPMPLLVPWSYEATFAATMIFPLAGVVADLRRTGRVHPAWGWGIAGMVGGALLMVEAITYTPVGDALYRAVTAGSRGAAVGPLDFPAPPLGPRRTGGPS